MLPTKEELKQHLLEKMTNQDIAKIYGTNFQKVQQLIKKYNLNQDKLRKVDKQTVYLHLIGGEVVYVGSGNWYRCRRYTNRRNKKHKELLKEGKVEFIFVEEFDDVKEARAYEAKLIKKYKRLGQAKFNKQVNIS